MLMSLVIILNSCNVYCCFQFGDPGTRQNLEWSMHVVTLLLTKRFVFSTQLWHQATQFLSSCSWSIHPADQQNGKQKILFNLLNESLPNKKSRLRRVKIKRTSLIIKMTQRCISKKKKIKMMSNIFSIWKYLYSNICHSYYNMLNKTNSTSSKNTMWSGHNSD